MRVMRVTRFMRVMSTAVGFVLCVLCVVCVWRVSTNGTHNSRLVLLRVCVCVCMCVCLHACGWCILGLHTLDFVCVLCVFYVLCVRFTCVCVCVLGVRE